MGCFSFSSAHTRSHNRALALSHKELVTAMPRGLADANAKLGSPAGGLSNDVIAKRMDVRTDISTYRAARRTALRALDGNPVKTATLQRDLATMRALSNKYPAIVARSESVVLPQISTEQLSLEERFARLKAG